MENNKNFKNKLLVNPHNKTGFLLIQIGFCYLNNKIKVKSKTIGQCNFTFLISYSQFIAFVSDRPSYV